MAINDIELVLVGEELLKGQRPDSHLRYLGRTLLACGLRIARAHVVRDQVGEIADVISGRLEQTRVLLVTGGLGPTLDDVTREAVARALGRNLEFHAPSWASIEAFFHARGREPAETNRRQAFMPAGARAIDNGAGTAPGFAVEQRGTTVVALPGPPEELRHMMQTSVIALLREVFRRDPVRVEIYRTTGIGESDLANKLGHAAEGFSSYEVSWLPWAGGVDIVLTQREATADRSVLSEEAERFGRDLRAAIGRRFYERGERSLFEVVGELLTRKRETVAVAESLTGGWIGKGLTDVPGSSAYFLTDVVAYHNDGKVEILGVGRETLARFGAVSEEVCTEMAHGVRRRAGATYGLATTGIAGPSGGTPEKPVGLTFMGLSWDGGALVKHRVFVGDRDQIRQRASHGVLWLLYDHLEG